MSLQNKTNAGRRDKLIRIDQPVVTDGDANSDLISWAPFCEAWSFISQKKGYEAYQADRLSGMETTTFNVRYIDGLTIRMRVVFGGFAYRIISITSNNRRGELDIAADWIDNEVVT